MSILNLANDPGESSYYTQEWLNVVDEHLPILKKSSNTVVHELTPQASHRWQGNFTGYLTTVGVPPHLHYVAFRLNNYVSNSDFKEGVKFIYLPYAAELEKLMSIHRTNYR